MTLSLLATALFAQTAKYTELLNKATKYENKKEWCYALGYYYDAIAEDPENSEKALTQYTAITDAIKEGKPGPGDYNEFTLHDSWIPFLQNTEKYWTEFFPRYFTFSEIKKGAVDYETHKASYSVSIKSNLSAKYKEIQKLIEEGYKTAYRSDWTNLPENWPETSIFSTAGGAMQKGAALFIGDRAVPAFYFKTSDYGLYDLNFSICDENDVELLKSGRYLEGTDSYTFNKVSANSMAVIDSEKVTLKLTAIYLEYGTYNKADDDSGRGFVKHLHKLPIPLKQNEMNIQQKDICNIVLCVPYVGKQKQLDAYKPVAIDGMVFVRGISKLEEYKDYNGKFKFTVQNVDNFYMAATEVTQAQYQCVMGKNPSYFIGANRPVERVSWYDAVAYCNKRSEQEGLPLCYSGSGDSITCDFTANGYRLPTNTEWGYAAKGGKDERNYTYAGSNTIGNVAWYTNNNGNKTHDVATKKPNTLGIYDMSGNVWEWCWDMSGNSSRVSCGGGYSDYNLFCTVGNGLGIDPSVGNSNGGFRVVRSCSVK